MIVLDTNVVSALMQRQPDSRIVDWLNDTAAESIWTTAITVFEVRFGIELLEKGRRRLHLEGVFESTLTEEFDGRVLPFDELAARAAATASILRRRDGRPPQVHDIQIAGIVASRKATLATRNVRDFDGLDLRVVNPWSD